MPKKTFRQRPKRKAGSRRRNRTLKGGTGSQDKDSGSQDNDYVVMYFDNRGGVHYTEESAKAKNEYYISKKIDRLGKKAKKAADIRRLEKNNKATQYDRAKANFETQKEKARLAQKEEEEDEYQERRRQERDQKASDLLGPPPSREIKYDGNYVNAQIALLAEKYFEEISKRTYLFDTEGRKNLEQNKAEAIKAGSDMFKDDIETVVIPKFNKIMNEHKIPFLENDRASGKFSRQDLGKILELFDGIMRENIDTGEIKQEIRRVFMTPTTAPAAPSRSWFG